MFQFIKTWIYDQAKKEFYHLVDKYESDMARQNLSKYNSEASRFADVIDNRFVTCEKCGCLVSREYAKKGESVIEVKFKQEHLFHFVAGGNPAEEVIRKVYYCKQHAPKSKLMR